jgi:hypothetical protein
MPSGMVANLMALGEGWLLGKGHALLVILLLDRSENTFLLLLDLALQVGGVASLGSVAIVKFHDWDLGKRSLAWRLELCRWLDLILDLFFLRLDIK